MTEEYSHHNLSNEIESLIDDLTKKLTNFSSSNYNPKLVEFSEGEQGYVICLDSKIFKCKIVEVKPKDENENFSFVPFPLNYKISFFTKLANSIRLMMGKNVKYPYPFTVIPRKTTPGVNLFHDYNEAEYHLHIFILSGYLNVIKRLTNEMSKIKEKT